MEDLKIISLEKISLSKDKHLITDLVDEAPFLARTLCILHIYILSQFEE